MLCVWMVFGWCLKLLWVILGIVIISYRIVVHFRKKERLSLWFSILASKLQPKGTLILKKLPNSNIFSDIKTYTHQENFLRIILKCKKEIMPITSMSTANWEFPSPADLAPSANPKNIRRKSVINREYSLVVFIGTAHL